MKTKAVHQRADNKKKTLKNLHFFSVEYKKYIVVEKKIYIKHKEFLNGSD